MRWPPYKHVIFDCDSTLTTIEGIDVLAENAGKSQQIKTLTNAAMDGDVKLEDVYGKRLAAIHPSREQIIAIKKAYKKNETEDAHNLITALKALGHEVYIISGGLLEPVKEFGIHLGVPAKNIRAVGVQFNQLSGNWWLQDNNSEIYLEHNPSALTLSEGKAQIVQELVGNQSGKILLIGDGISDQKACPAIDLFVGFGGITSRQTVLDTAPVFIHSSTLAPLLLLAASPSLALQLKGNSHQKLLLKALKQYSEGAITFQDEQFALKFKEAYQAVYSRTG